MGRLTRFLTVAGLLANTPAAATGNAERMARWQPLIAVAAGRFGLPAPWIARVIQAESAGETTLGGVPVRSRAGAIGLMQLMPATWAMMRDRYGLGHDPDDPHDNIIAGAAYLRLMVDRFGYPGAIGAYNAGPARYAEYLARRSRLPAETLTYLQAVTGPAKAASIRSDTPPHQMLFAIRHDLPEDVSSSPARTPDAGLYAVRTVVP